MRLPRAWRGLASWLAFVMLVIAAPVAAAAAVQLTITEPKAGAVLSSSDWGWLSATVRLVQEKKLPASEATRVAAWQAQLEQDSFIVLLDGKPIAFLASGAENGSDARRVYTGRSFRLRPSTAGPHTLEVRLDRLRARAAFKWNRVGGFELADLVDGQFFSAAAPLAWHAHDLQPGSLSLILNGRKQANEAETSGELSPADWKPGENVLLVSATDAAGKPIKRRYQWFHGPEGRVPVGASFQLPLGEVGSRSGPFFRLICESEAVKNFGAEISRPLLAGFDASGLPIFRAWYVAKLVAEQPGTATLVVESRSHFREPFAPDRRLTLVVGETDGESEPAMPERTDHTLPFGTLRGGATVTPSHELLAAANAPAEPFTLVTVSTLIDSGWQRYQEENGHFSCYLPAHWNLVDDPAAGRFDKIHSVEAYRRLDTSGALVRLTASYYAPGNRLNYHKADDFISVVRGPGPEKIEGESTSEVAEMTAGGARASTFTRLTFDFLRPTASEPGRMAVHERYVVIPAEAGFYVLRYKAPVEAAPRFESFFSRLVSTFQTRQRSTRP